MTRFVLSIDQGTTGTTVVVLGEDGQIRGKSTQELPQHFPEPGWVEHEPEAIWTSIARPTT